jgi:hypothetical protein
MKSAFAILLLLGFSVTQAANSEGFMSNKLKQLAGIKQGLSDINISVDWWGSSSSSSSSGN